MVRKMTIKKIRGLIVFTILIFVGLWNFKIVLEILGFVWGIIFPFVLGGSLAFVINVPMTMLEKKLFGEKKDSEPVQTGKKSKKKGINIQKLKEKLARPLSLIITLLLVIGLLVLVIFFLVPQLAKTFSALGNNIAAFIPQLQEWVEVFTNNNQEIMKFVNGLEFNPDKMISWGVSFLGNGAGSVMNTTFAAAKSIVSGVGTFFIAFSFACYVLIQKESLHVQVQKVLFAFLPQKRAEAVLDVCSLTYKTFSSFLAGQCLEAVILGSMFVVSMSVLRMSYALLIGVLIAFSALIPVFGAFIGCGAGTFLIFMVNPQQALAFIILFLVLQQIEGNFIYPHVVGNSVGLPSIWVLAAVSVGGQLMGVVGMLICIPISSVVYTLFRKMVYERLEKRKNSEASI